MSAGFRWTVSSQPRVLVLNKPMAFEPAPAHRKNRWAVDSLDYSAREVISIASGRMEVEATIKFEKNAQGLVDMLRDAADGNVVTYYPDLSNGTGYALWLVSESTELAPQAGNWSLGNYEVRTRWRDASASGTSIAPLFERLLFRLDAGHFPLGYSMTRSGTVGPYIDSDGVLKSAAANIARIEWVDLDGDGARDPLYRGELARTNEVVRSEALDNASWTKSASSISADQATGPDGVTSLDEIVESGTTAIHSVEQAFTGLTADAPFALSGFFRANTRSWVRLLMYETATPANVVNAWYNLTTGVVGTTGASGTAALVRAYVERDYVTGLYRPVLVGTIGNSATAVTASIRMATGDGVGSYAGDGSSSIYGGYMQMEDNATSASSYIATTTAAATRNADTLDIPIAFGPQACTIYFDLLNDGQALGAGSFAGDVWTLGRQGSGNGFVQMDNGSGSAFRVVSVGASGASASRGSIGSGIEVGQRLRGIAQISSAFGVAAQYQIDEGATTTLANVTNADGIPADWAAQNLRVQIGRIASLKIAAGTKTMAQMRAL